MKSPLRFQVLCTCALAAVGFVACESANVTAPGSIRGPLTIAHGYVIYQTAAEYKAAFAAAYERRRAEQGLPLRMECGPLEMTRSVPSPRPTRVSRSTPTPNRDWISTTGDPFFRIGALHPYKVAVTNENGGGIPWGILQLFYPLPGRFVSSDPACSGQTAGGGGWSYGDIGDRSNMEQRIMAMVTRRWPTRLPNRRPELKAMIISD